MAENKDGFTVKHIMDNKGRELVRIYFTDKPSAAIRTELKSERWWWNTRELCWQQYDIQKADKFIEKHSRQILTEASKKGTYAMEETLTIQTEEENEIQKKPVNPGTGISGDRQTIGAGGGHMPLSGAGIPVRENAGGAAGDGQETGDTADVPAADLLRERSQADDRNGGRILGAGQVPERASAADQGQHSGGAEQSGHGVRLHVEQAGRPTEEQLRLVRKYIPESQYKTTLSLMEDAMKEDQWDGGFYADKSAV